MAVNKSSSASYNSLFIVLTYQGDGVGFLVPTNGLSESRVVVKEPDLFSVACAIVCSVEDHCVRVDPKHFLVGVAIVGSKV